MRHHSDCMRSVIYHFCGFRLGVAERELSRDGNVVLMPARVFELLAYLLEHRDRAVGRDELVNAVFGRANVSDGQLSQVVLRARRCLGDGGKEQRMIRTVPRFGFRWVAEVYVTQAEALPSSGHPGASESPAAREHRPADPEAGVVGPDAGEGPPSARILPAVSPFRPGAKWLVALPVLVLLGIAVMSTTRWLAEESPSDAIGDSALPHSAVLVLPAAVQGDSDEGWARLGLMDLVAKRLRSAGLAVPESESTLTMLAGLEPDTVPTALAAGEGSDVSFVQVDARAVAQGWQVDIRMSGESIEGLDASARDTHLLSATHAALDDLLIELDRSTSHTQLEASLEERLQRATAAMYSNDLVRAREILTDARELHESHPLLRHQLAQIDFREGRFEEGAGKLQALLSDGELQEGSLLHVQTLNSLGAMYVRLGRYAEAEATYHQAEAISRPSDMPGESGRALMGRGLTRALQGHADAGLLDLGRARVRMQQAGDVIAVARVDSNLGTVELVRNRPAQAVRHFERARDVYAAHDVINERVVANTELAGARMALLEPQAAWEANEEVWALRHRISDPGQLHRVTLDRVEILLRAGRLSEAVALIKLVPTEGISDMASMRHQVVAIELLTATGAPREALAWAEQFMGERQSDLRPYVELQAWLRWRRQQAALQAGEVPQPLPAAREAANDPRARVVDALARALEQDLHGDAVAADALFLEAVQLADQGGSPRELVEAVAAWVPGLIARGELEQARAMAGRIAAWGDVDFEAARVSWLLYRAVGDVALQEQFETQLQRLAGERTVGDEVLRAP